MNEKQVAVERTDLRSITRSATSRTVVMLDPEEKRTEWLVFGEATLRRTTDRQDGRWFLDARMEGMVDVEHDSCLALRLPLIGVEFNRCDGGISRFTGWVDPDAGEERRGEFRVPRPGYDPRKLKGAEACDHDDCRKLPPHVIVPLYLPPFDPQLYKLVRGTRVEIFIGRGIEEQT